MVNYKAPDLRLHKSSFKEKHGVETLLPYSLSFNPWVLTVNSDQVLIDFMLLYFIFPVFRGRVSLCHNLAVLELAL